MGCCVDCAKYALALRDANPGAAKDCQQYKAEEAAFKANTRSATANLWKMHRRGGEPMVFCGGSGFRTAE